MLNFVILSLFNWSLVCFFLRANLVFKIFVRVLVAALFLVVKKKKKNELIDFGTFIYWFHAVGCE